MEPEFVVVHGAIKNWRKNPYFFCYPLSYRVVMRLNNLLKCCMLMLWTGLAHLVLLLLAQY